MFLKRRQSHSMPAPSVLKFESADIYKSKKHQPKKVSAFSWRRTRDSPVCGTRKIFTAYADRLIFRPLHHCRAPLIRHRRWSHSMPAPSVLKFETADIYKRKKHQPKRLVLFLGGGQEIRTLAPVSRPTPLAGEPLWPLE